MLKRILRSRRGEGYIDVCVLVLCAMLVIALAVQVLPAFIAKQQLDTFATELVREAEIAGRIGPETDRREQALRVHVSTMSSQTVMISLQNMAGTWTVMYFSHIFPDSHNTLREIML